MPLKKSFLCNVISLWTQYSFTFILISPQLLSSSLKNHPSFCLLCESAFINLLLLIPFILAPALCVCYRTTLEWFLFVFLMCFWPPDHSKCVFIEWWLFFFSFLYAILNFSLSLVVIYPFSWLIPALLFGLDKEVEPPGMGGRTSETPRSKWAGEARRKSAAVRLDDSLHLLAVGEGCTVCPRENSKEAKVASFHKSDKRCNETPVKEERRRDKIWLYLECVCPESYMCWISAWEITKNT